MSRSLALLAFLLVGLAAAARAGGVRTRTPEPPGRVWQAGWIWCEGEPSPRNSYVYFRKTLELDRVEREAKIHLTADSRYQLWVNGAFIGRGPVRSDRRWQTYDTWDLTEHLKKGSNAVAVLVHHYGEWTFQYQHGRGGLIAEILGNAGRPLGRTDRTWKALRSEAWATGQPRMSIQLGFNEIYDARKAPEEWQKTAFPDSAWPAAREIGEAGMAPWPRLVARDIPPMLERPMAAKEVLAVLEAVPVPASQHVDLFSRMDPNLWSAAYLATTLRASVRRRVTLHFGSDDALRVWLNGKPVLTHGGDRAASPDQDRVSVELEPGDNRLLAKVVQGHSKWEYYFALSGETEGVTQTSAGGAAWSVAGPFPYPMAEGIEGGLRRAFPPEERPGEPIDPAARFRNAAGRDVAWRPLAAGSVAATHISQLMASSRHGAAQRVQIENPAALLSTGPRGTRVQTAPGADAALLVDFGREVTGFPRFRIRGARGGEIVDMGYGEVLHDASGSFIPQSEKRVGRLNPERDGVHYADRYICRPGTQEFQTFDKRGFRYLQIDIRNAPEGIEIDGVGLLFSTYPVEYRGAFQCSDPRLNRIWEIGRWTCQLNMEDGYTDCPWRERGQWWGDARVEALINYYCFGDTKLIRRALRQKAQSLNEEGITWGVYPTDWDGGRLPSFTLIWVSTLWETYRYTGDRAILEELYPAVRSTLDRFFAPKVGPRGLLKDVPYWVFIDWAPVDDKGESGALNAYYYDALRSAAQIGRLIGDASGAEYERRAAAVRESMNRHLWDPTARAYRDSLLPDGSLSPKISQQTNSLCVLFDIAPPAERGRILDTLYDPETKKRPGGLVEAGSPYFSFYQLGALYHEGRHAQALAYIRTNWGRMLDWGATTWWEMWSPGASFCHGWSGGPTYNLPAEVLGIRPLKPGFAEVEVAPQWLDLQYATGVVPTVKGDVQVAWQRDAAGGTAAVRVETEEGVPVEVLLPGGGPVTVNRKQRLPAGVSRVESPPGTQRFRAERGGQVLFELRDRP